MLKLLRKGVLLYVLISVAGGHWLSVNRTTSWQKTLWVAVHPINGDGSARSSEYISALSADSFNAIASFVAMQGARHQLSMNEPMRVVLGAPVKDQPPLPPVNANTLSIMWWSLKLRYWAWQVDKGERPPPSDINVFVRYFDPDSSPRLAHSLGLQKGLIGVANAFATRSQSGSNQVIIAHVFLHTPGATEKYDPATTQPLYPIGYAEPDADPRYPQSLAEIMAGRIPRSATESEIPRSLDSVVIGIDTATEIGWH